LEQSNIRHVQEETASVFGMFQCIINSSHPVSVATKLKVNVRILLVVWVCISYRVGQFGFWLHKT